MLLIRSLRTDHVGVMTDLPKISTAFSADSVHALERRIHNGDYHPQLYQKTSLPSFASLQERANQTNDPDDVEIAPMSSRMSCYLCNKLKPMLREVAITVAELDESVQSYCNTSVTRVRCCGHVADERFALHDTN